MYEDEDEEGRGILSYLFKKGGVGGRDSGYADVGSKWVPPA